MSPWYASLCLICAVTLAAPHTASGQNYTPRDSTEVIVAAVLATLDTFGIEPRTAPVWISFQHTGSRMNSIVRRINARFPFVRAAAAVRELFTCPSGVSVQMPGQGCPIKDDGVIADIGELKFEGDSVALEISVIRSAGRLTWATGHTVIVSRRAGSWRVTRTKHRFIT